jgi:adenosylcobinamide-GDP ribazoletransferase
MIRLFFATLSFISRLPVPSRLVQGLDVADYVRGIVTFPFVGVVLGGISGGVFMLLQPWCGRRWRHSLRFWRWRC